MGITFDHTEQLSDTIASFYFKPEQRLRFVAGQFVELYVPHSPTDNRGQQSIFTLITEPREPLLGIAASFPEPSSSFKRTLKSLTPGAEVQIIGEPMGDFVLPKDPAIPMVWLAGGVAAASFVAMAKELARSGSRRVTLFQSAKRSSDLIYYDIWQQAGLQVHQTVTGEDSVWQGQRGRFSAKDLLAAAGNQASKTMFYVSGSDTMVEATCHALMSLDIPRDQLVREAYTGY